MLLKLGSRGEAVEELQLALSNNGSPCAVDGVFGKNTEKAVKVFQHQANLLEDGKVGFNTFRALGMNVEPLPAVQYSPYTLPWYQAMFDGLTFDPGFESQIKAAAMRVLAGKNRYEAFVAKNSLPMPWHFVGVTHNMECSCNWRGVLHNGQLIVGTDRKTTIVPKGRGPFKTWEDAALDALKIEGLDKVQDWSMGNILRMGELFNGKGYQRYKENTPYLWAMTSVNDGTGKYVSDGKYDSAANANTQVGEAAILKWLQKDGFILV